MAPVLDHSSANEDQICVGLDLVEQCLARIEPNLGMCADNDSLIDDALRSLSISKS